MPAFACSRYTGLEDNEFCPRDFEYVLPLRHPLERMNSLASTLSHGANASEALLRTLRRAFERRLPLAAVPLPPYTSFLGGEGLMQFDNALVRFTAASSAILHAPFGAIGPRELERAAQRLQSYRALFVLRGWSELGELAAPPFSWRMVEAVDPNHHGPSQLTASQLAFLAEVNRWDLRLFERIRTGGL